MFFLPFLRLFLRTLRPPEVFFLVRKPWVLALLLFFGLYVCDIALKLIQFLNKKQFTGYTQFININNQKAQVLYFKRKYIILIIVCLTLKQ